MPAMKIPITQNELNIVVYDMDGTLIRGDCAERFIRNSIKASFWRSLLFLLIAPIAYPLLSMPSIRKSGVSAFLWVATVGLSETEYLKRLDHFIEHYPLRPIEPVLAQCRKDIADGLHVVIATGASEYIARGLLKRLTLIGPVRLVASQTKRFLGGLVSSVQCNGEIKLQQLILKNFQPPYLRVYSDSALDLPILLSTTQPILVNASERDRKKCRQHCPHIIEPSP
jgi:phosphatidylglycerophosphatase C